MCTIYCNSSPSLDSTLIFVGFENGGRKLERMKVLQDRGQDFRIFFQIFGKKETSKGKKVVELGKKENHGFQYSLYSKEDDDDAETDVFENVGGIRFEKCKEGVMLFRHDSMRNKVTEIKVDEITPMSPKSKRREMSILSETISNMAKLRMEDQRCTLQKVSLKCLQ